jgi:dTDP-4-dehydrorhamnose reductase
MHILLIGKFGQLGWELNRTLVTLGQVTALDFPQVDLSQPDRLPALIDEIKPDLIVNAAAYTAVDRAESERQLAQAINGIAPGILAEEAQKRGIALVHYSTDYVFGGDKGAPYVEADTPNPLNVYGQTKLAGERAVIQAGGAYLILRTSWVYSLRGDSFVAKVLRWARQNSELNVVSDQVSGPTWARLLAEVTAQLLATAWGQTKTINGITNWLAERRGVYHLAGDGFASRLEWANAILRLDPHPETQLARSITPAATADFPTPAQRPLFSALDCTHFQQIFGFSLPAWQAALHLAMAA